MIDIRLTPRKNPNNPEDKSKYYPAVVSKGETSLDELTERIARMSTLSKTDCIAVLTALVELLPQELLQGRIVRLGNLGAFRLTVKGEGVDKPEAFSSDTIKQTRLRFNPGIEIKKELLNAKFQLSTSTLEEA